MKFSFQNILDNHGSCADTVHDNGDQNSFKFI